MPWSVVLKVSVGAAVVTGWVWQFRRRGATAAETAELRNFKKLISALPDHELSSILADYEFMAAVAPNRRFGLNRDACREEMCKRAESSEPRSSGGKRSLDISVFEVNLSGQDVPQGPVPVGRDET
jgi:hypothetical protein